MNRIAIEATIIDGSRKSSAAGAEFWGTGVFRRIEQSIAHMVEQLDKPLGATTLTAPAFNFRSHFFALCKRRLAACRWMILFLPTNILTN